MPLFATPHVNLREKLRDPENRRLLSEAITKYLRSGVYHPVTGEIMPVREILIPGEPEPLFSNKKFAEVAKEEVPVDLQWAEIFRTVPSTKEAETYANVSGAITFKELRIGEKPQLGTVSAGEITVPNLKYGAAFGFHREWIDDNRIWLIEDTIRSAKEAAFDALASFMYGLLLNANFPTVSKPAGDNSVDAWIDALNKAFAKLKRAKKLKPNVRPIVICPPEKRGFIDSAIASTQTRDRGSRLQLIPKVIDTAYFGSNENVRVLVPKRDFIYQEREKIRTEEDYDIMADAHLYAWYFRFNGLVRNANAGVTIEET